jgi:hypothetical protein
MNEAEVQENKSTLESSETKKVPEVQVEKTIEVAEDILLPETIAS